MNELFNRISDIENIIEKMRYDVGRLNQLEISEGTIESIIPLTTKGDILGHDGLNAVRKAVGANGKFLKADSTQTDGLLWADTHPLTTNGDIMFWNTTLQRLGIGSTGQVLTVSGGLPVWANSGLSVLTTKGDIFTHNGTTNARLAVGDINNMVLVADSAEATGLNWVNATSLIELTTEGDILRYIGTGNARLARGTDGQILTIDNGTSGYLKWATPVFNSPVAVKGDILTFSTEETRLGVGLDGYVLTANSGAVTGLNWANPLASFTTKGQIRVATASGVTSMLNVGTNGYVLTADSAESTGMKWVEGLPITLLANAGSMLYRNATEIAELLGGSEKQILRISSGFSNLPEWQSVSGIIDLASIGVGDTIYYDGTDYQSLAAGTNGQFMQQQGGIPSWASISNIVNLGAASNGDIIYYNSGAYNLLPIGSGNDILQISGGLPSWSTSDILNLSGSEGDIIYHNGTNWALLPIAPDNDELKVVSGLPSWSAPSFYHGTSFGTPSRTALYYNTDTNEFTVYNIITTVPHRVLIEDSSGDVLLSNEPTLGMHPATKNYVDIEISDAVTELTDYFEKNYFLNFIDDASDADFPPMTNRYVMSEDIPVSPTDIDFTASFSGTNYVGAFFYDESNLLNLYVGTHTLQAKAYKSVVSATVTELRLDIYKRDIGGTETLVHTGTEWTLTTGIANYSYDFDITENVVLGTDRLFVRVYIILNSSTTTTATIVVGDSSLMSGIKINHRYEDYLGLPQNDGDYLKSNANGERRWVMGPVESKITATGDMITHNGSDFETITIQDNNHVLTTVGGVPLWQDLGITIDGLTSKTTPVDADDIALSDSAASHAVKKLTWANLKATLKTYFDSIYFVLNSASNRVVDGAGTVRFKPITYFKYLYGTLYNGDIGGFTAYQLFPRWADYGQNVIQDYQDELAFADKWATITYSTNPDYSQASDNYSPLFRDDSTYIEWNTGTPFPLEVTLDFTSQPITPKNNAEFQLGLTTRSGGVELSTVKIELWDGSTWIESFEQNITDSHNYGTTYGGWFISHTITSLLDTSYNITKMRVTIGGNNAQIANAFRLQRFMLYHGTAPWDTFHVHKSGDTIYGTLNVEDEVVTSDLDVTTYAHITDTLIDGGTLIDQDIATVIQSQFLWTVHGEADGGALMTNQANADAFLMGNSRHIQIIDLTGYEEFRIVGRLVTASTSANTPEIRVGYSTTATTTLGSFSELNTSCRLSLAGSTGGVKTSWFSIDNSAKTDVWLCIKSSGGDGAADPELGSLTVQFRRGY